MKICGLMEPVHVKAAVEAGADAIGFVFAASSRRVTISEATALARNIPDNVLKIGVFVDATREDMEQAFREVPLDYIQFHGNESSEYIESIGLPSIKSFPVASEKDVLEASRYNTDYYLFDTPGTIYKGGSGVIFDWQHLQKSKIPTGKVILAGGLNAENVREAIEQVKPFMVDVSSGVECNKRKDTALIYKFVRAVKDEERWKMVNEDSTKKGRYGKFGGQFVPETLMTALIELEEAYDEAVKDSAFNDEVAYYLKDFVGRETPLYFAEQLTKKAGGAKIYLKREDLNHTGAHKINNTVGQALLAVRMGKKKIVAETGAGQHGVATATVCALFGLACTIFMGKEDIRRQELNVFRMELLGATVVSVDKGAGTLKDAVNEALRYWVTHVEDTHYILGSALGPHPFPKIVRNFQRVIGVETRKQMLEKEKRLPDAIVACVGGGSNAIGIFHPFLEDEEVKLYGVEAAGSGIETGLHSAAVADKKEGVLHGAYMYVLQDDDGLIQEAYSISAGLDYPAIGPEHSHLHYIGRVKYTSVTDAGALEAFQLLSITEGIIPALESAHAVQFAVELAGEMQADEIIVICLSGRGDKDVQTVKDALRGEKNDQA